MKRLLTILILCLIYSFQTATAQSKGNIIVGKVSSRLDGPLIGVVVKEIDATNRVVSGTTTDINGDFSLSIKSTNNKLEVSYLGYHTRIVNIGAQKNFDIDLKESDSILDEVVVHAQKTVTTGAMNIPEREIAMAVQTLKAEFQELSVASIDEALQGQIAGLDIIANSGDVGAGSAMRLRGTASINANVTPLIVVNELIYDTGNTDDFDFVNANNETFANLLSINVDDIEDITVLKDAAATALWGSRGANGVISIKTKRGTRGKPIVTYTYRMSQRWQPEGMKMLNGDEYTMFLKESYFNPSHSDVISNIPELSYIQNDAVFSDWRMYNNNTDWVDAVKRTGVTNDHYLAIRGGGERATFSITAGYFNEKGSIISQELNRYSSRMDLQYSVSDRIVFSSDMALTYTDEQKNLDDLLALAYKKMPNLAIYRENIDGVSTGEFYAIPQTMSSALKDQKDYRNPVASAKLAKNNVKSYHLVPTFRIQYDLLPYESNQYLRLKTYVSFNIRNGRTETFLPRELSTENWTEKNLNKSDRGDSRNNSTTGNFELQYKPRINNEDHSVMFTGQAQISGGSSKKQSQAAYGLPWGVESPTTDTYFSDMKTENGSSRGLSFTFMSHYSYQSKYNLSLSLRREGSSQFGPKRRFGNFGGLSIRWNIIDEKFMKPAEDWMSMLALRLSYGVSGNRPGEEYLHFSRYEPWSSYIGAGGIRPVKIRLNDLRWEKVSEVNTGFDIGFLKDKITASFNYYDKKTTDLLSKDVLIPSTSGFDNYARQNGGSLKNQGWELHMNLNKIFSAGKFSVENFNLNFANNKNIFLELSDIILDSYNPDYQFKNGEYMARIQLNNSLGSIYGFRYKGVYQYSIDNPDLIESNYTLGTAPVARDANGNIILDSEGKAVPMYFAYGTNNQIKFQGGDAIYEDINNDGNINELDIVYLGNSSPKINGGMGFRLRYDRISMNIYSAFRYGNKIVNKARMNAENMSSNDNQSRSVNWRWRKEGDLTSIPRALHGDDHRNYLGSDRYVEDGSFWRINQISLNYNLPENLLNRLSINSASVFLTMYNVLCFTNYSGADPEVGYDRAGVSYDNSKTPRSKSFTVGCSVRF